MLQKLGIEKSNYRPTFKIFMNMFIWNAYFEKESKPKLLQQLQHVYGSKVISMLKELRPSSEHL
ncbi:hypothetical protein QUF84_20455 [Fictibacillus enclensis]|uniref:hypothetical protein n=1 Tax=Fictibacillus enclensis TaxID=1017270 RepID=UPI0025A27E6B|nr:hypothetical protein [Fictibacillus enclensis]MDM5339574.1 hypothetical protein [Fictibacillus enclensis]